MLLKVSFAELKRLRRDDWIAFSFALFSKRRNMKIKQ